MVLFLFAIILSASTAFAIPEVEVNDTFGNRQFLPIGTTTVEGSISSSGTDDLNPGDLDFFTFSGLLAGSPFTAEITSGDFDTQLGWYNDIGDLIEYDDDDGGLLSLIDDIIPLNGILHFAVASYDYIFSGYGDETGSYVLSLDAPLAPIFEPGPGPSPDPVPEPGTVILMGIGIVGLLLARRKRLISHKFTRQNACQTIDRT